MVWVGDLFTVLSPLDSLKLNEGVVHGVLFILDDRASACAYYPDADFQTHISVLVRVRGFEPPMWAKPGRLKVYYTQPLCDTRILWWNASDLN